MRSRKTTRNLTLVFLALTMLLAAMSVNAQAAAKKVKAMQLGEELGNDTYKTTTKQADKKALTIKKGTTDVRFTKGFLKFKAPKKGTYKFTFSKYKPKGDEDTQMVSFGNIVFLKKGKQNRLTLTTVSRETGYTPFLQMIFTKQSAYLSDDPDDGGVTFTVKRKMKKNEVLYLYISNAWVVPYSTMRVKIK